MPCTRKSPDRVAVRVDAALLEREQVVHLDLLAFHAGDLADADDLAPAAGQAARLHDDLDRAGDLRAAAPASGCRSPAIAIITSSRASASRGVVGVDGGHRAFVAGVHRLEHVQRLGAAALADDDAVRPHAQAVLHQVALRDLALAFDVRRARLQAHDVRLLELQLGRVLDRDDALVGRDVARQAVQQRRLARAGAAADQDVAPRLHGRGEEVHHRRRERAVADQVLELQRLGAEAADATSPGRPAPAAG